MLLSLATCRHTQRSEVQYHYKLKLLVSAAGLVQRSMKMQRRRNGYILSLCNCSTCITEWFQRNSMVLFSASPLYPTNRDPYYWIYATLFCSLIKDTCFFWYLFRKKTDYIQYVNLLFLRECLLYCSDNITLKLKCSIHYFLIIEFCT